MTALLPIAAALLAATSTPKVGAFHGVDIGSGFEANIARGATASVTIEADEKTLKDIEVKVDDGTLKVGMKSGFHFFKHTGKVVVSVVTPNLDAISGSGGSTIKAVFTPAKKCDVSGSGGSTMTISSLACEELVIDLSGGSHLDAVGHAQKIKVEASGGSHAGIRQVPAAEVSVEGSGGSEIRTFASRGLKADLSGGSELYVAGKPAQRSVEASGGAQIIDID
jgi:hypothetical protein